MENVILIRRVGAPFGWLSNMSRHQVRYLGHDYRSAEALFQAMRFESEEIRAEIRNCVSPMAAKWTAYAHEKAMTVIQRSAEDLANMRFVLGLKISQHPELRKQLLETGDSEIIEDCTRRKEGSGKYWGAALREDGTWEGENWLGKLWMEVRAELREMDYYHRADED